jgi:hypothetical protein
MIQAPEGNEATFTVVDFQIYAHASRENPHALRHQPCERVLTAFVDPHVDEPDPRDIGQGL